jgi:hypothetical protein
VIPTESEDWKLPARCPRCGADLQSVECRIGAIKQGTYYCGSVRLEDGIRKCVLCLEPCRCAGPVEGDPTDCLPT